MDTPFNLIKIPCLAPTIYWLELSRVSRNEFKREFKKKGGGGGGEQKRIARKFREREILDVFSAFTTIKERSTPDSRPHEYKGGETASKRGGGGGADRGAGESERGNMTGIKVDRGGGDSGRFDQGRAKSRTVPSLFFQAWLLRAQRFKGLAYFRSLSRLLPREIEYFQRRFYTPPRGKMLFDIGLRLRHFVSHLFESFDKSSTISDYTVDS